MARIQPINRNNASSEVNAKLDAVKAKLGKVPNVFATFAHSSAVLNGYLVFSEALSHGKLSAAQREAVALAIAQANSCQYCLSAHTLIAKGAGLNAEQIKEAREAKAGDESTDAILKLAVKIVNQRGILSDQDFTEAYLSGIDDELVLEVIANVALHTFTNYTNHIAQTDVDFPVVNV